MKALRKRIISVVGAGNGNQRELHLAYEVGVLIGQKNYILVCGGLGGVMEEACKGAKKGGGLTIGLLPWKNHQDANRYVDIPLPTGLGEGRNYLVATAGEALIAVGGKLGTLTEISYALKQEKPVALLGHWEKEMFSTLSEKLDRIYKAESPLAAVEWVEKFFKLKR